MAPTRAGGPRRGDALDWIANHWIATLMIVGALAVIITAFAATRAVLPLSRAIDALSVAVGKTVMWLVLVAVLVSTYNAVQRYAFNVSSNAWLEIQWYLYGAIFLLAAAYTLQRNEHIRIDVVASMLSRRSRSWIDLFGHILFLLPLTILIVDLSIPWVELSYRRNELSDNAGGLIRWPAKALVPAGFFLLYLQGLSEVIKRAAVLRGVIEDPNADHDAVDGLVEGAVAMEADGTHGIDEARGAPVVDVDDRRPDAPDGAPRTGGTPRTGGRS